MKYFGLALLVGFVSAIAGLSGQNRAERSLEQNRAERSLEQNRAERSLERNRAERGVSYFDVRTLPVVLSAKGLAREHTTFQPVALATVRKSKHKIAIIDTGYDGKLAAFPLKLCKSGHYDFYSESSQIARTVDHGTLVSSIIASVLQEKDYCAIIYQVVDKTGAIDPANIARAVMMASKEGVTAVNISITGQNASFLEQKALRALSASGAAIFVAAGNERRDLNYACQSFPACYDVKNLYIVGALTDDLQQPAQYSNHGGRVKLWYAGTYWDGITHAEGTSFASPRALADYVLSLTSPLPTK